MKTMILCPNCMGEVPDSAQVCPLCGGDLQLQNLPHQLPVNTILHGRYLVGKVLGEGGFGITYIGLDLTLRDKVAIKEYYPSGVGTRYATHSTTLETSAKDGKSQLEKGKQRFLEEAQVLARFRSVPSIVTICDFFFENNTGYIIMEYLEGQSLSQWLQEHGPEKDFNTLYRMLRPVMEGLEQVHQAGLIHRDISLSNLMLLKDGTVKLLDFGTARDVSPEGEKSLSVVLKPGFAPVEQYQSRGSQGPWTDVYALCASMYKLLIGVTPETSVDRVLEDRMQPPSQLGASISREQEQILMKGMAIEPSKRLQSMGELCTALDQTTARQLPGSGRKKKSGMARQKKTPAGEEGTAPNSPPKKKGFVSNCKEVFLEPELLPKAEPGLPDCKPLQAMGWTLALLLITIAVVFIDFMCPMNENVSVVILCLISQALIILQWWLLTRSRKNLPLGGLRKALNLLRWLMVFLAEMTLGVQAIGALFSISSTVFYILLLPGFILYLWFSVKDHCKRKGKPLPAAMALRGLRVFLRIGIVFALLLILL